MGKKDYWDVLFWILMAILVGYIILKIVGLINTPEWVDLIPMVTIVFLIGVFYQKVMGFMDIMYRRTDFLKTSLNEVREKLDGHDKKISGSKR